MKPTFLKALGRLPPETVTYLGSPVTAPITLILAAGLLYQLLNQASAVANHIVPFIILALLLILLRAPRWTLYLCLFLALAVHTYYLTQVLALSPPRSASTRDRAAMATALALWKGTNPWNHAANLPVPPTTGPAAILLVLPFVKAFGNIALMTYLFWMTTFGFVVASDVKRGNKVFPALCLIVMMGLFGFQHTMEWRLEELYFPYLIFVLAYYCLKQGWSFSSGLLLAVPPLSRVSYCFMVVGFLSWAAFSQRRSLREYVRLAGGFLVAVVTLLTPFALIGRADFWRQNFVTITQTMPELSNWSNTSFLFQVCTHLTSGLSLTTVRILKEVAVVLLIGGMGWLVRRRQIDHPFWHIAVAAFLSHTIVWHSSRLWLDYALIFVIPAFFGAAMTPSLQEGESASSDCGSPPSPTAGNSGNSAIPTEGYQQAPSSPTPDRGLFSPEARSPDRGLFKPRSPDRASPKP